MDARADKAEQARKKILNAAVTVFAGQGYVEASTNRITAEAGVAKGLVFHYFGNKQRLYLACLEHVLGEVDRQLQPFLENMPADLFERLSEFLTWKSKLFRTDPTLARFLLGAARLPEEVRSEAGKLLTHWRQGQSRLLAHYDEVPWRPGVRQDKALQILVLVFEALDQRWLHQWETGKPVNHEEALNYAQGLLDVLQVVFYMDTEDD